MTNKYLEKIALHTAAKGAIIGSLLGATDYRIKKHQEEDGGFRDLSTSERIGNGLKGAVAGGVVGGYIGYRFHPLKSARNRRQHSEYQRPLDHGSLKSHFEEMGVPDSLKRKAEVTKFYKTLAMRNHPDRGGSTEKMAKINAAWNKIKQHPDFEKMAEENRYIQCLTQQLS